jgi:CRISPR-associated protein (TIGR03986 family)
MMRLPYWTIEGTLTLQSPLHIGTGEVDAYDAPEGDGKTFPTTTAQIALTHDRKPCIPAPSLKGALRALAVRSGWQNSDLNCIFGEEVVERNGSKKSSIPGCLELEYAVAINASENEWVHEPHVDIDPVTGTAEDQKLFHTRLVPTGTVFDCRFHFSGCKDKALIEQFLGLLAQVQTEPHFALGGRQSNGKGRVTWQTGPTSVIDPAAFAKWFSDGANGMLVATSQQSPQKLSALAVIDTSHQSLAFDFTITFDSPFMVNDPGCKDKEKPLKPRINSKRQTLLPVSSLRGALRGQARRILRTMPLDSAVETILIDHLFGKDSYRSLLRIADSHSETDDALTVHMIAIDRLTGGGKDGATFSAEPNQKAALQCRLQLDKRRFERLDVNLQSQITGLLALVLRDLDEGDIRLGYGAAKGFGLCRANSLPQLSACLGGDDVITQGLQALRTSCTPKPAFTLPTGYGSPQPMPMVTVGNGHFHNPYAFIPIHVGNNKQPTSDWQAASTIGHSKHAHDSYHPETFSGRIVCSLTNTTPMFIGSGRTLVKDQATKVEHFKLNGKHALPATSLRGLFSSLHESITSSNLRVMGNEVIGLRVGTSTQLKRSGVLVLKEHVTTKERVWFIREDANHGAAKEHRIPKLVVDRFTQLIKLRFEDDAEGNRRHPKTNVQFAIDKKAILPDQINPPPLTKGQKVYFEMSGKDNKISEFAWSPLWRKRLETASQQGEPLAFEYIDLIKQTADTNALSFGLQDREALSPTELMFGVVEDITNKPTDNENKQAFAFASKVHIGYGRSTHVITPMHEVLLKILASPKPPSPAMYLQRKTEPNKPAIFPTKAEFAKQPANFTFNGRKNYLHALRDTQTLLQQVGVSGLMINGSASAQGMPPWESHPELKNENAKQKVKIQPLPMNSQFIFEVDFKNLSESELASLCATLCPSAGAKDKNGNAIAFEHKIGMGKPLGLGSARVEILGLFLVDRQQRYTTDALPASRYQHIWRKDAAPAENWPSHLQTEAKATATQNAPNPNDLAASALEKLQNTAPDVYNAILLLGNPAAVKKPVHYPQVAGADLEKELFKWFMDNDAKHHEWIRPFTQSSTALPMLSRKQKL